jgi:hypothetical protein
VNHAALNGARPNDGHLDDQVVETGGFQSRKHGHLRAALDLEDAHGVGALDHLVGQSVLGRHVLHPHGPAALLTDQVQRSMDRRQHAQRQTVDFQKTQGVEVVLVPLDDAAVFHSCVFHRHKATELVSRDHEAAGVLAQVPRKAAYLVRKLHPLRNEWLRAVQAVFREAGVADPLFICAEGGLGQLLGDSEREAQGFSHVADCRLGAVRRDNAGECGPITPVLSVDVLHDLLPPLMLEIDVDVRRLLALFAHEAFKQDIHSCGVDFSDAQAVADGGVRGRATPLTEDVARPGEAHDVLDREEIRLVLQARDDGQFVFDLRCHFL